MLDSLDSTSSYYSFPDGYNPDIPVVLLALKEGPPQTLTDLTSEDDELPFFDEWYSHITVVPIHQAQELDIGADGLDSGLLSGTRIISDREAEQSVLKSAAIIHKVAAHFKAQEKTVYIIAKALSSYLVLHTIYHYGNNFDKIILTTGRLDASSVVIRAIGEGCGGSFNEMGLQFTPYNCQDDLNHLSQENKRKFLSGIKQHFALGKNTYTDLLQNAKLDNVLYVYGQTDQVVGRLNSSEISFLEDKGAQVLAIDSGHDLPALAHLPASRMPQNLESDTKAAVFNFLLTPLPTSYELLTMPAANEFKTYLGGDDSANKFKIGIVFEGHTDTQISYKMNELFGTGPFSLFQTVTFQDIKDRIYVEFARIDASSDTNSFPAMLTTTDDDGNNVDSEFFKRFSKRAIQDAGIGFYKADIGAYFSLFLQEESVNALQFFSDIKLYMNIFSKKQFEIAEYDVGETLSESEREYKEMIYRNLVRFLDLFTHSNNSSKTFHLKVFVSPGFLGGGYANQHARTVYMEPGEFDLLRVSSMGKHPHHFAITGVHEMGHIIGDLEDEYYRYSVEDTPTSTSDLYPVDPNRPFTLGFVNNCFSFYSVEGSSLVNVNVEKLSVGIEGTTLLTSDDLGFSFYLENINNPWTHPTKVPVFSGGTDPESYDDNQISILQDTTITGYGGEIYVGCNLGKTFRSKKNSIMRVYNIIPPSEWVEGWGAVNSFYLRRGVNHPVVASSLPQAPVLAAPTSGDTQATLNWTVLANDGGTAVLYYEYQQKKGAGSYGNWIVIPRNDVTQTDSQLSYIVSGLTNATSYKFKMRAVNSVGRGAISAEVGVTPATGGL